MYLRIFHYLKARNIGKELPTTVHGLKIHLGQVEALLVDLHDSDTSLLCGFKFEFEFQITNSLMDCFNVTRNYSYIHKVCLRVCTLKNI